MGQTVTARMLQKVALYLTYLRQLPEDAPEYISAAAIAEDLHMGPVNVRKDLAAVTRRGVPKQGRKRTELIADLEYFLGLEQPMKAIYVGNMDCVNWVRQKCGGYVEIMDCYPLRPQRNLDRTAIAQMSRQNRQEGIRLAILDAQADVLQNVAEQLTKNGIEMIWNFSAAPLVKCGTAMIQNESLFPSLGILTGMVRTRDTGADA